MNQENIGKFIASLRKEKHLTQEQLAERLRNTCFGNYCPKGECVETGACVLRFLEMVRPEEQEWIEKLRRHL